MAAAFYDDLSAAGDAPALLFPSGRTVTYADLDRRVGRLAADFGSAKALIAVEGRLSEHAIVAYLAALRGGHAVALLPPGNAAAWTAFRDAFRPDALYRCDGGRWRLERATDERPEPDLHPDLAVLLSTSGTTGQSRSVRLSAGNLIANAASIVAYLGLTTADRGVLSLPLHYCYGLSVLNSHLAARGSVLVQEKSVLDDGFVADMQTAGCTNFAGVPYSYDLLERIGFRDAALPALRFMTVAGGRLHPDLVARYHRHLSPRGARFFVMYGQTEATARMAYVPPERLPEAADTIGVPVPGGALGLIDADGRPIERPGVAGELVYRGPNVMMGHAATRADLARGPEHAELRTGDLAERDASGLFRIVGRLRRMSKIAGIRVGHDMLEQALAAQGITAAVVGDDARIWAAHTGSHPDLHVRRLLIEASGLPPCHVGSVTVDALPRLPSGKTDYQAVLALGAEQPTQESTDVAELFRQTFFPIAVAETDTFVGLGGDSLRHVQLSMGLERILGCAPEGWERRTVGELMRRAPTEAAGSGIASDLLIRAAAVLLVVLHHATWWPIPGGAAAMMMLVGYSLARFQSEALVEGRYATVLRSMGSVLAPYFVIVAGFAVAWGSIPWSSVFLIGNFGLADPDERTMLPLMYWFVEAFVQLNLLAMAVLAVAPARRLARRDPFAVGLAFLGVAVAARFVGPVLWPMDWREIFTLHWNLYLAAFGWCAVFAAGARQKMLVLALAVVTMPVMAHFGGNWVGGWVKFLLQIPCLAVLLYRPRITVPRRVTALVLPFSVASYHIYLFHGFAPDLLRAAVGEDASGPLFTAAVVVSGVALGLLAHHVQRAVVGTVATMRWRRPWTLLRTAVQTSR